ncbi:COPII coat assembly protein sec16 [Golovinomyces cichoracearum]|uniref:Protein transport protein sec16 n=1 Tax=Golovinomyces cichoracearum TaxID=62708 RepID=A0A420I6A8_9PEZI|nr:COPII coat assembly protein sec16 [Golovinomyces cichoracearum]
MYDLTHCSKRAYAQNSSARFRMSPKPSSAPWNPALMPNNAEAPVTENSTSPTKSRQLQLQQYDDKILGENVDLNISVDTKETISSKSAADETEHDELQNIGISEISTGTYQHPESQPDFIGQIDLRENTKFDVKKAQEAQESDLETPKSKHKSTISFTRTVSEEVTWTEDEIDTELTLQSSKIVQPDGIEQSGPPNPFQYVSAHNHTDMQGNECNVELRSKDLIKDAINNETTSLDTENSSTDRNQKSYIQESPSTYDLAQADELVPAAQTYEEQLMGENSQLKNSFHPLIIEELPSRPTSKNYNSLSGNSNHSYESFDEQRLTPKSRRNSTVQKTELYGNENNEQSYCKIYEPNQGNSEVTQESPSINDVDASYNPTVSSPLQKRSGVLLESNTKILENCEKKSDEEDLAARWREALCDDDVVSDCLLDDDGDLDPTSYSKEIDPAALFGSDDEGFLDDIYGDPIENKGQENSNSSLTQLLDSDFQGSIDQGLQTCPEIKSSGTQYMPTGIRVDNSGSRYKNNLPVVRSSYDIDQQGTQAGPSTIPPGYQSNSQSKQSHQIPSINNTKSFANMSKGGYSSPYDLPIDLAPKKRTSIHSTNRLASLNSDIPPPMASMRKETIQPTPAIHNRSVSIKETSQGDFFEDLPISSKPKPAPRRSSMFNSSSQYKSSQMNTRNSQPEISSFESQSTSLIQKTPPYPQLKTDQDITSPERSINYLPSRTVNLPNTVPSAQKKNASSYNPSHSFPLPASQTGTRQYNSPNIISSSVSASIRSHYPRTSSPLAHFERSQNDHSVSVHSRVTNSDYQKRAVGFESENHFLSPTREVDEADQSSSFQNQIPLQPKLPVPKGMISSVELSSTQYTPPTTFTSQSKQSSQKIPSKRQDGTAWAFAPPQRSQTQSPQSARIGSKNGALSNDFYQRSASVELPDLVSSIATNNQSVNSVPSQKLIGELRQPIDYLAPTDGREHDPLQRWKGSPIFTWGVGGSIVTSFPKSLPRYGMNQLSPMIQRCPGEVKISSIKEKSPLDSLIAQFPGPLRGKSKKKNVVAWLTSGIELLEAAAVYPGLSARSHDEKRSEERLLLWKILRIFIEHDGILEGTLNVQNSVKAILSPEFHDGGLSEIPVLNTGAELICIPEVKAAVTRVEATDLATVDQIQKYLSGGEREKAVWEAVDKRLWAHALLISNTISPDLYKQVTQEFVQKEVRTIGENTQSLAVLYEIFAGNFEESIDELVPPSARAGFQMVSTSNVAEPSKDASVGIDRWRETLNLVLSNRSTNDYRALIALGKLLAGYGRAEAAHICFLFARSHVVFSGIDDPLTNIVLLGSDHLKQPHDFDREVQQILLSEVFDYGMSLSNQDSTAVSSPHLAIYKLHYAKILTEHGLNENALKYCEAIAASVSVQSRRSPYHHALLISEVEDLSQRLRQSSKDESSSWISKPSIDKAKGSVWATFNKFVAGEESDTGEKVTNLSVTTEAGPFSKISGETPTISRSPSNVEIHGLYTNGIGMNSDVSSPITVNSSLYTSSSAYKTVTQNRPFIGQRSMSEQNRYEPHRYMSLSADTHNSNPQKSNVSNINILQASSNYIPPSSYAPYGMTTSTHEIPPPCNQPLTNGSSSPHSTSSQTSKTAENPSFSHSGLSQQQNQAYSLETQLLSDDDESSTNNNYQPQTSIYEPLLTNTSDLSDSSIKNLVDQKSAEDKSNEIEDMPTHLKEKSKAEKDREADEAFRLLAEADAQKTKESPPVKKGWSITSWFSGGAKKGQDETSSPNKPIRAKLGEASSFVYDPELKRWVNKKNGTDQVETKHSTPPPRAVGPRVPGSSSHPASKESSDVSVLNSNTRLPLQSGVSINKSIHSKLESSSDNRPAVNAKARDTTSQPPPMPSGMASTATSSSILPPSRPGTSMSNASSIDDLLGPPSLTRRSGTKTKKKGRGYVDVMSDVAAS